jgi:hypothetical protein
MTTADATLLTGGLSAPSKMPGFAYSIPATACKVGSRLAQVEGSVCRGCYALKGRYSFPIVQAALARRLALLETPEWADAMVALILAKASRGHRYFRWHDSGDLQSGEHLTRIVEVCERTPDVRHWLPTREYAMVKAWRDGGGRVPANLTIRLSGHMVDGPAPDMGLPVSTVHTAKAPRGAHACPAATPKHRAASKDGGPSCGDCRACWQRKVAHVSYPAH